jgi:putative copper export protein/mono/diheme cytochrome c family protein/peroxiredoxin
VTGLLIVVRSVHLAALMLFVGTVSFLVLVARPAWTRVSPGSTASLDELDRRLLRLSAWSLVVILASALVWLALQAVLVSGFAPGRALGADSIGTLSTQTQFGRVWIFRLAVMTVLGALLLFREREQDWRDWLAVRWNVLALAAALAGSLAFAGHAAATDGGWRGPGLVADAVHVVAAGLWFGGLFSLLVMLRSPRPLADRVAAPMIGVMTRRFSALALGAVATIAVSGVVNTWIHVGDLPRLIGTPYGRLLLAKLVLFGSVLILGAVNRMRLIPTFTGASSLAEVRAALGRLRRNVVAELALGGGIVVLVGALGVTPPARHVQPSWPFSFRLSWQATSASPSVRLWLVAGSFVVGVGLLLLGLGWIQRHRRRWAIPLGLAIGVYGGWLALGPMAIDAYPTTYRRPAIAYQATSIARGAALYRQHCASCHGVAGHGDGPAARALPKDPADLTAKHAADHTAGDFFWWLSHGIPRSPMPGFAGQMDEEQRWDVINFVRALAAAETARFLTPSVSASRPVVAPDFSFGIGVGPPGTLKEHRGWALVHLVLFTAPSSLPRLIRLDATWSRIGLAGARVIAVPMRDAQEIYRALGLHAVNFPIAVDGSEEIVETYGLFCRQLGSDASLPPPAHVEFLIDRQGYIRARWLAGVEVGWTEVDRLLEEIARLDKEAPRAAPPEEHVH